MQKIFFLLVCFSQTLSFRFDVHFSYDFDHFARPKCSQLSQMIVEKVSAASRRILVAVYTFSSLEIASAIVKKFNQKKSDGRVFEVCVLVDPFSEAPWGKLKNFYLAGVPVLIFNSKLFLSAVHGRPVEDFVKKEGSKSWGFNSIMHNKYIIIDDEVFFGSYNFTFSANFRNCETLAHTDERRIVDEFVKNFNGLKNYCDPYQGNAIPVSRGFFRGAGISTLRKNILKSPIVKKVRTAFVRLGKRFRWIA